MTLKTAVVAPMPRARERTAVRVNPGWLRSWRKVKRRFGNMGRVLRQQDGTLNTNRGERQVIQFSGKTLCEVGFVLSGFEGRCPGTDRGARHCFRRVGTDSAEGTVLFGVTPVASKPH